MYLGGDKSNYYKILASVATISTRIIQEVASKKVINVWLQNDRK